MTPQPETKTTCYAWETSRIFKGTAARDLVMTATKDQDSEIADYANKIKGEME